MSPKSITVFKSIFLLFLFPLFVLGQSPASLTKNDSLAMQLNIPEIKPSHNDIDLRVFLDRGTTTSGQIIRIVKKVNVWTGTKYDYQLKIENGRTSNTITKSTKTTLKSKHWDSLWINLEQHNILTLPTQEDIKDKLRKEVITDLGKMYDVLVVMDGSSYDLTVAKGDILHAYSFRSPWEYAQEYPEVEEVRNYDAIVSLLEKEFQIKFRQ
jgi:hypothetical protein